MWLLVVSTLQLLFATTASGAAPRAEDTSGNFHRHREHIVEEDKKTDDAEVMVPSFLLLGSQKTGSTTMWEMLTRHKQIVAPRGGPKELHFFNSVHHIHNITRVKERYLRYFPTLSLLKQNPQRASLLSRNMYVHKGSSLYERRTYP